ncbi:MAG TPA: hypothetical protein VGM13_11160 [Thermoanaerobaculia bacterium]
MSENRGGGRACGAAIVLILAAWGVAAVFSDRPLGEKASLLAAQAALTVVACLLVSRHAGDEPADLRVVLPLHALLYSGLSNVVPALLPALRPASLAEIVSLRMPESGAGDYAIATLSALGLLVGWATGLEIVSRCFPASRGGAARPLGTPRDSTALAAMLILFVLVAAGTLRFGLEYAITLSDERVTTLGLGDQLLFHGLFSFMPIGPALAAIVWMSHERRRPAVTAALVGASCLFVGVLGVWRMRSTAMLAVVLPMLLLSSRRRIDVRRWALPGVLLVVASYAAITAVRISDLEEAVREGAGRMSAADFLGAVGRQPPGESVSGRALFDASYRTAGLEPVAALVAAQDAGRLPLQEGRVLRAGFEQALPASLRTEFEVPERVKTAPSLFGIFTEGDWVTTFAAEAVLDSGAALTFLPGVVAGLLLGLVDRLLLRAGNARGFDGILVVRMAFLLYPIAVGASVADMTLLFLKATVGYAALFVLASLFVSMRRAVAFGIPEMRSSRR